MVAYLADFTNILASFNGFQNSGLSCILVKIWCQHPQRSACRRRALPSPLELHHYPGLPAVKIHLPKAMATVAARILELAQWTGKRNVPILVYTYPNKNWYLPSHWIPTSNSMTSKQQVWYCKPMPKLASFGILTNSILAPPIPTSKRTLRVLELEH